jgi:hypothetical protein
MTLTLMSTCCPQTQLGGSARGYQKRLYRRDQDHCQAAGGPAVWLCIASACGLNFLFCRGQSPTAPDRMNAKTRGKMWQNSPPPQESTSPPARSIASHNGSADRTKASAVAASTSRMAHISATISRRESGDRSYTFTDTDDPIAQLLALNQDLADNPDTALGTRSVNFEDIHLTSHKVRPPAG